MATHSSILAWEVPWTEEFTYSLCGCKESDTTEQLTLLTGLLKLKGILGKKVSSMTNLDSILKSRDITLPTKMYIVKATVFPVVTYGCNQKEGWALENWYFQSVVLEKTLESPLNCKEVKPVNPKENEPWIFMGRTDAEAPILWPPDAKSQLITEDLDAGKDWRQKKRVPEDEMVR